VRNRFIIGRRERQTPTAAPAKTRLLTAGGVLIDAEGRVLLREPANHFDGYVWTFPKGRVDQGEDLRAAALREVKEETGYDAEIIGEIDGVFEGGTSVTFYFLMKAKSVQGTFDRETASTRWVTFEEAKRLIKKTTNATGRDRDLKVLIAAQGRR
jgi:ADP-ribose pyrophosphatase YjhB (NUDIX family)